MSDARLRRLQWVVRATLALGVAASVTANILHAYPHPVSQAIAAWPPLALLITVELVSRIPVYRKALAVVRLIATAAIAGIAAWVSYGHMAEVVARYGETGTVPYLLPLSVDGLIVVASVSLVELAGRRRGTAFDTDPIQTTDLPTSLAEHLPCRLPFRQALCTQATRHPTRPSNKVPKVRASMTYVLVTRSPSTTAASTAAT